MANNRRPNRRGIIFAIGGISGLIAIAALVVTIMQYIQSVMATASDDSAQATMIAILDSQLRVQNEIATAQVLVTTSGPNATSAAERVTSLVSTQEVLERERQQISQTITAISIENTIIPTIAQSTNEAQPNSSSTSVASPNHIDCSNSIDFGQIMTCLISTGEETKAHTFSANGDDRVLGNRKCLSIPVVGSVRAARLPDTVELAWLEPEAG